jgi:hypothetical protein
MTKNIIPHDNLNCLSELSEALRRCEKTLSEGVDEINSLILGAGKMQRRETIEQAENMPVDSENNN